MEQVEHPCPNTPRPHDRSPNDPFLVIQSAELEGIWRDLDEVRIMRLKQSSPKGDYPSRPFYRGNPQQSQEIAKFLIGFGWSNVIFFDNLSAVAYFSFTCVKRGAGYIATYSNTRRTAYKSAEDVAPTPLVTGTDMEYSL